MLPYGRQSIEPSDVKAVIEALRSDWLTTGPAVAQFESDLASWTGGQAVSVTSGTAALHVAYAALDLQPGDEVITTPLTFIATASCAALLGAHIVFADVCDDTGNLDPDSVAASVSQRTRAVAGVDFAGHPIDSEPLARIAHEAGAYLLEDAAHSIGSTWNGRPVGSLSDITTLSFFPTKNLTTAEGGAVVTSDQRLLGLARRLRNIGLVRDPKELRYPDEGPWHQEVHAFGLNYRLADVLCALGSSQLARLGAFKTRRAALHARYNNGLADVAEVRCPTRREGADPAWHLYPARILGGARRALFDHLRRDGIGVQVNYLPVYWHPVFEDLGYRRGLCPVAEEYYHQEISLPLFSDLSDNKVDRVVASIRDFFGYDA